MMSSHAGARTQYMHESRLLVSYILSLLEVPFFECRAGQLLTAGRSAVMLRLSLDGQSSRLQK